MTIVLIIAILVSLYTVTYSRTTAVRTNERARAMLVELANASKLYNELYPNTQVYGGFGENPPAGACTGCVNPCALFRTEDTDQLMYSFALVPREWQIANAAACSTSLRFEGYKFVLCNPYYDADNNTTQPDAKCLDNNHNPRFAVLISPANAITKFNNREAWITQDYVLDNNYL